MVKKIRLTHPEDYYLKVLLEKTRIEEVMTAPVISIKEDAVFSEVVPIFLDHHIRHLPVVNEEDKVVGMMTERLLYKIQSPRLLEDGSWYYDTELLNNIKLSAVMMKDPFVLNKKESVSRAIAPMVLHKIGGIPIVDDQHILCGIITQYDLLDIAYTIVSEGEAKH